MDLLLVLLLVLAFPIACLAFVLWMGCLEDSIAEGVRQAVRQPDPEPILAVPVRRGYAAGDRWPAPGIPAQRGRPSGFGAPSVHPAESAGT